MSLQDEIRDFFVTYVDAFARRDAKKLSEAWDAVGLFPSPTGNFAMSRDEFGAHLETLLDFYEHQGVVLPVGELLFTEELFPNVVHARMAYRMLGDKDVVIAEWEHVYVLRRSDCWRISLTIADGEMAAWAERGAQL